MDITARVAYTFPRRETTPDTVLWSGILEYWSDDLKNPAENTRLLKLQTSLMVAKNGRYFLSMPYQQRVENGRLAPVRRQDGKYFNLVEVSFALGDLGIAAIEKHLDEHGNLGDKQRQEAKAQTMREEGGADDDFGSLPF